VRNNLRKVDTDREKMIPEKMIEVPGIAKVI